MGNDPTEHRPDLGIGSETVKNMLETLPKYYQKRSKSGSLSEAVLSDAVGPLLGNGVNGGNGSPLPGM